MVDDRWRKQSVLAETRGGPSKRPFRDLLTMAQSAVEFIDAGELRMGKDFENLHNGIILAELGGYGDGPYCARHGAGAALVMLGTYIVDPGDSVPYHADFVFKPGRSNYQEYLEHHVAAARVSGAQIGVSVVSIDLRDTVDFLQAAREAGADYASLCAHSPMKMFIQAGVSAALCYRQNWDALREWTSAILDAVDIPVIFKVGANDTPDIIGAVEVISEEGVPIIHINVEDSHEGSAGLAMIAKLQEKCTVLIAGGGVKDIEGARRVLRAGADGVAIGTAAMEDPGLCGTIQSLLRNN